MCNDALVDVHAAVPDNGLACKNAHAMCVTCVGKMAFPTTKCGADCSGLAYRCPLCRSHACLQNIHILVLAKGSWAKAFECFPCEHAAAVWNEQVAPCESCDED